MQRRFFLLFLLFCLSVHAEKVDFEKSTVESPWFTGPLFAPSGYIIPPGHGNIEPYIFATANIGAYDPHWKPVKSQTFWNTYFQPFFEFGLTDWFDFEFYPTLFYNYTKGAGMWELGDMPVGINIQLYKRVGKVTEWATAVKLTLRETFPLGKYQNLNPKKFRTDIGGTGSWQTAIEIVWGNLFYLGNERFMTWRTSLQYTLPAPVHVKNFNFYGGGPGTHGTVYPAQNFQIDTAVEIGLTKNWAFAMDILGSWSGKVRFKGKTPTRNTAPSATQFSLAPAIEYNWNNNIGLIFGPWFTIAGRNSIQFASGVFAFNVYY